MIASRHFAAAAAAGIALSLVLGGCVRQVQHDDIPPRAALVSEGDARVSFMAPDDGTVYVYDQSNRRIVYSGKLEDGQTLVVDPERDRVAIDGTVAMEEGLFRRSTHRIYFEPARPDREVERVRVEERRVGEPVERRETRIVEPARERFEVEERRIEERQVEERHD